MKRSLPLALYVLTLCQACDHTAPHQVCNGLVDTWVEVEYQGQDWITSECIKLDYDGFVHAYYENDGEYYYENLDWQCIDHNTIRVTEWGKLTVKQQAGYWDIIYHKVPSVTMQAYPCSYDMDTDTGL